MINLYRDGEAFLQYYSTMPYIEKIAVEKAAVLNSNPGIYGTFAEIGAGQEVVNHFFKAGKASQTVAKSMSAYDMTFSDQIYGHVGRYVSLERLFKMLDHEYSLLEKRLKKTRGHNTRFFAFADTVAASTLNPDKESHHHGWMGIRFQNAVESALNEIILHVDLLDKTRLQQYETLGVLGLNLIYSAFYGKKDPKNIIKSLIDNFESARVDINVLRCSGGIFKNLNHQQLNMELIRQNLTNALLFQKGGKNILPMDALYGENVLVIQYESSNKNFLSHVKKSLSQVKKNGGNSKSPVLLVNVPIQYMKTRTINELFKKYSSPSELFRNYYILVSNFKKLYELRKFIRQASDQNIFISLSASNFRNILQKTCKNPDEDTLEFLSRLYDQQTVLISYGDDGRSSSSLYRHLEKHLIENKKLVSV